MMSSSSDPPGPNRRAPRNHGSSGSSGGGGGNNQMVKFARRTSSGRYVSLSGEDLDGDFSGDYMNYTVHIPPTPDHQPVEGSSMAAKAEEQYVSNSLFTGGFNSVTRAHLMDKVTEGDGGPHGVERRRGKGAGVCHMPACDGKVMMDDQGNELLPCECRLLVFLRFVALILFLTWRVQHPNRDAVWLWLMSITCEIWFAFSWILDQVPKIFPINRSTDLAALREKFEMPSPSNPTGRSDLPGIDFFVSTADPEKEPVLVTANTILSILAVDHPVEKISCYLSDDGGALLTFEAMAEAASFAELWVPFCRKHNIEPRNPESYFAVKGDPTKNKIDSDFVKDRRKMKREYDEFKVKINSLPDSIRRRSEAFNAREEMKMIKQMRDGGAELNAPSRAQKATWMADGTHWPGTWAVPSKDHAKGDHAGILQVKPLLAMLKMQGKKGKLQKNTPYLG